ncbi:hypothetical protein IVB18_33330 [Bradyrhizobium sp. 186]|uniref:hypothetical protein n=1 Tax=Bradyrhizobium sp. 186 TaxID=2782654 RepID=UPI0020013038|nr:hypothetical protein [Bradyrhizobium sp. 186]UPK33082.1 hypothetical protein IVB18_33330 [Bradyrhizobium sp. 186]
MTETTFSFIPRAARSTKPRKAGLTEIRGPYYSAYGPRHLADVLALQLLCLRASESMGNHDSNVVDAGRVG